MGRAPLSIAQKKERVFELLHETKSFFKLDELEKMCDKQKGVTPNSVRSVLEELISEDKVKTDKIGTQTLFWALPSVGVAQRGADERDTIANISARTYEVEQLDQHAKRSKIVSASVSSASARPLKTLFCSAWCRCTATGGSKNSMRSRGCRPKQALCGRI